MKCSIDFGNVKTKDVWPDNFVNEATFGKTVYPTLEYQDTQTFVKGDTGTYLPQNQVVHVSPYVRRAYEMPNFTNAFIPDSIEYFDDNVYPDGMKVNDSFTSLANSNMDALALFSTREAALAKLDALIEKVDQTGITAIEFARELGKHKAKESTLANIETGTIDKVKNSFLQTIVDLSVYNGVVAPSMSILNSMWNFASTALTSASTPTAIYALASEVLTRFLRAYT